jgi:hypothetical protein
MFLTKGFVLGLIVAGIAVIPATAGPVTWNFGSSTSATGGVLLTDGTTITGTFTFDNDVSTANCGATCLPGPTDGTGPAADYNGLYGLFGNGVNTTGGITGSFAVTLSGSTATALGLSPNGVPTTWYINTNNNDVDTIGTDCCSDNSDIFLVSKDPTTTNDLDGAYGILMQVFPSPMTDSGGLWAATGPNANQIVLSNADFGVCDDYACGQISQSGSIGSIAGLADPGANVNSGQYIAPISTSGTPEPSTWLLGASALAFGAFRKRFFFNSK